MNFNDCRFDDRILKDSSDGEDFARFVGEYIALAEDDPSLVKGLAKGRDGAIDLINVDSPIRFIGEAKFIGADTQGTALERWTPVKKSLKNNLIRAATGNGSDKFRPWLKSQGELTTYGFFVSSICRDADERISLKQEIEDFFLAQSKLHQELSHLGRIDVRIVYWDDVIGASSRLVPLFFRWFGGYPPGFGELSVAFGTGEDQFRRFLASGRLPYFSRAQHAEGIEGGISTLEVDALNHLVSGNEASALIVSGPGGIGKTRLSIELCQNARSMGWWPLKLERYANVDAIGDLCRSFSISARILILIDYAEFFDQLERLPSLIQQLERQ